MLRNEKLMSGLIRFGQGNMHDFIVRSKAVNFDTFENNEVLRYTVYQAKNQGHQSISQNITHAKNNQEEG